MSVSVTQTDGVTVFTLTSNPSSVCPPLCQILGSLCYSPRLCSLSHSLRTRLPGGSLSALGALQIMTGLLNIALGTLLLTTGRTSYEIRDTYFPVWLGILFIVFGIASILSERFPSPCLLLLSGTVNLIGAAFSITGIVIYSINLSYSGYWWMCNKNHDYYNYDYSSNTRAPTTLSPEERTMLERCNEAKVLLQVLFQSITAVLIVLSFLEFCLVISSATLSFKALRPRNKKSGNKPLLEEGTNY